MAKKKEEKKEEKKKAEYTKEERQAFKSGAVPDPRKKGKDGSPAPAPTPEPEATAPTTGADSESSPLANNLPTADEYQRIVKSMISGGETFGRGIADEFFPDGSMGRMATDVNADLLDAINKQKAEYELAQKRTAEDQMILDKRMAGLDGYTAEENAALREAMRQSLTRDYATQQRDMARLASRGNVSAGAAMGNQQGLAQGYMKAGAAQGRDLLIANVDEKQKRLNSLSDYVAELDNREFAKRKTTLDAYTGSQSNRQAYQTMAGQYNDAQKGAETAGRVGSIFGGIGSYTGLLGGVKAEGEAANNFQQVMDLYKEQQRIAQQSADAYQKSIRGS